MEGVKATTLEKTKSADFAEEKVVSPPTPIKSLSVMEESKVNLGHLVEDEDD